MKQHVYKNELLPQEMQLEFSCKKKKCCKKFKKNGVNCKKCPKL